MKNRFSSIIFALVLTWASGSTARAEIAIGVSGPLGGEFGVFGEQMVAGAQLAVEDINAQGGVLGQALRLEAADDECETETAVAVANQMVGRDIRFMAGHFCFGPSIAASEVYAKAGIVQISPATTQPRYTDGRPGPGVFRLAPRDDAQGPVAAGFLADLFGGQRIAIVHDRSAYGKGLADAVKAELNSRDIREVLFQGIDVGADDYEGLVSTLQLQAADVLFFAGYHPEAAKIVRGIAGRGLDVRLMGTDALATDEFWLLAAEEGEGTLFTLPPDPRRLPEAQALLNRLPDTGPLPGPYVVKTYSAVQAWAEAVGRAGTTDLEPVGRVLAEASLASVMGPLAFDENGDVTLPDFDLFVWRDGSYAPF
ncbi:branched chain amino acid ABC transporter substrate-binding protein [Roseibium aquae]|uniref:Branched chain amino acid ABC transporter substrate-binding protein n=1 Tax=Roseibium aquae TaxID=1323746 RepID=A0A916TMK3_9HYPH|nr:branched-chain amino acid ABC transporter substrate-binding protein [Roseibium aquae]GGB59264.1 branched chain amino acid ABC transporter substrate-binding protein [Roseibium aquae]